MTMLLTTTGPKSVRIRRMRKSAPLLHVRAQSGVTLMELMVGIAIGLLVVAVSMGAMMISRNVSGTVSDASAIQQQAAYAMRIFGQQLRQAGSLYLDLGITPDTGDGDVASATSFMLRGQTDEVIRESTSGSNRSTTISFTGYQEPSFSGNGPLSRNCLGAPGSIAPGTTTAVESIFTLIGTELRCGGNGAAPQTIIDNVANFQVRYLLQDNSAVGNATVQYVAGDDVDNRWNQVQGVEVCLVLYGRETIDIPTGFSYTDCDGTTAVDMSSSASTDMNGQAIGPQRARRMHTVFRNVFQLRSQGLI